MSFLAEPFVSGAKKAGTAIATGNTQATLGLQSPHAPDAVVRIGRFLYVSSATWIALAWYTGYVNARTKPGGGPKLIIPGTGNKVVSSVARPEVIPSFIGMQTSTTNGLQSASGGAARLAVVRIASACVGRGNFQYSEVRPYPNSLQSNPCATDCSGFVTLCYKAAGAPDPNGPGYNYSGFGDTDTLQQMGVVVQSPNIADLAFWSNPDHVAVVVSTGMNPGIVEFGAPPSPINTNVATENKYHSSFIGYRSYL